MPLGLPRTNVSYWKGEYIENTWSTIGDSTDFNYGIKGTMTTLFCFIKINMVNYTHTKSIH